MLRRTRALYAKFEADPKTQYEYHRKMTIFWLMNFIPMNIIVGVDVWATLNGHDKVALLMTAVLLAINTNYSLYANFDTETGDAHAAYASLRADELKEMHDGRGVFNEEQVDDMINQVADAAERRVFSELPEEA